MDFAPSCFCLLCIAVCTLFTVYIWRSRGQQNQHKIPVIRGLPVWVGLALSVLPLPDPMQLVMKNPGEALMRLVNIYGPVYEMDLAGFKFVVVNGYTAIKEVLATKGSDYAGRFNEPKQLNVNPNCYGILEGQYCDDWKAQRTASLNILKSFGFGKRRFEKRIIEEVEYTLNMVTKKAVDGILDIGQLLDTSIANIICSMMFGERYDHQDNRLMVLKQAMAETLQALTDRPFGALNPELQWFPTVKKARERYARAHGKVTKFCYDQILDHQATITPGNPRDFVDAYIEKMNDLDDPCFNVEQLTFLLYELFAAGSETTANTLQWFVVYMANNLDVQEKMREEVLEVIGTERLPSLSDREAMRYTEAVLREVQRIRPVLPIGPFHVARRHTTLLGWQIGEDTPVAVNFWSVLNDPQHFHEPHLFNPERFLDSNNELVLSEYMIQFGSGPRMCMGQQLAKQELFLFATSILQRFALTPPRGVKQVSDEGLWTTTFKPKFCKVFVSEMK